MAQKSAARLGRKANSSGFMNSVELGRNGEYRPAKKPSPEGDEGSQSDHVRKGSGSTGVEAAAKPTTAEPTSSEDDGGQMSSKYSTSRRRKKMAKKLPPPLEEEEEDEEDADEKEKESEEESTEAPGPNPQPKRKRDSGRVTRSQQAKVPALTEQPGKEGAQPSESKKSKSKKITPAPLQQRPSKTKKPKANKITPPPLQHQDEEIAQPCELKMPKTKRIRVTRSEQPKVLAPDTSKTYL